MPGVQHAGLQHKAVRRIPQAQLVLFRYSRVLSPRIPVAGIHYGYAVTGDCNAALRIYIIDFEPHTAVIPPSGIIEYGNVSDSELPESRHTEALQRVGVKIKTFVDSGTHQEFVDPHLPSLPDCGVH